MVLYDLNPNSVKILSHIIYKWEFIYDPSLTILRLRILRKNSKNDIIIPLRLRLVIIGDSALHCAAMGGNLKIVELLITSGVPLQKTNKEGK